MKHTQLAAVLFMSLCLFSCKEENKDTEVITTTDDTEVNFNEEENQEDKEITVQLEPKSDSKVSGTAMFTQENGAVTLTAKLSGLKEGTHAMHLHEKGDCSAADGSSAGGHWNPTFEDHGEWGADEGYHRGDIGNFEANADGNAEFTFSTDQWCIGCDDEKMNIVGKAVIVHSGVDDYTSQPSGNAGSRISCGGIIEEGNNTNANNNTATDTTTTN
ncbi:MAG TPA: superoxide dismutase family protein [Salinimicrobium sp.]|nr:superoxide dismutase family protein [Salinimicrobium sp.]